MAFNKEKALKEAEKLVAKGKDKEALVQYKEIVKNDPRDLNSLNKIGDLHLKLGNKSEAIDCFVQIAEKYANDGFNLRAIAMYKKCTRTDPGRLAFHERLADLNAQQGLANEARAEYQVVADQYLKEGRAQQAREVYAKIAALEPDNLKTRLKLADLYLKDNQLNLALGEYLVIGSELAKKGMLDESLQVLQKALALDPSNLQILRGIARTHADMGRAEEGLRFIHGKLQEKGGNDPDLLLVLAEVYQAAGNQDHAKQTLARAAALAPNRPDVLHAGFKLCVAVGDADGALAQYDALADSLVAEGKGAQVIEDLRAILKVQDGHVPTLEKLVQVLSRTAADSKLQSDWTGRLAEAYIARGLYPQAEAALVRLVQAEPEVSQHAEKLEFVRFKQRGGGGGASAPAGAGRPSAPAADDSSFGSLDDAQGSGFSMSFDDGELEAASSQGDDRAEFVSERTAEADVFIKYGLVDKAVEQFQGILARHADDLGTRRRLKALFTEEGRNGEAVEQCVAIAEILRSQGDSSGADEALGEARDLNPDHPALAGMAPASAPVASGLGSFSFGSATETVPTGGGFDMGAAEPAAESSGGFNLSFDAPSPAPEPPAARPSDDFEISLDAASDAGSEFEVSMDEPAPEGGGDFEISVSGDVAAEPAPVAAGGGDFEISLDEPAADASFEVGVDEPVADGAFEVGVDEPELAAPSFELNVEAPAVAEPSFELAMDEPEVPEAAVEFEADIPVLPSISSGTDFSFDSDEQPAPVAVALPEPLPVAPAAPVATAPAPQLPTPPPRQESAEEGLFGEEADFFNFADELNKEMTAEEGTTEVSREGDQMMSLEQIISGMQSAVAQQVDSGDYETHYNLGIAYKEMGLQDEAIGEFQYASKDPARFLQCCILLGSCFTEKGMPELAVKWYEKGKSAPGAVDDDVTALNYEIGACKEAMGDDAGALAAFMDIYASNARYRDVGQHIARLKAQAGR